MRVEGLERSEGALDGVAMLGEVLLAVAEPRLGASVGLLVAASRRGSREHAGGDLALEDPNERLWAGAREAVHRVGPAFGIRGSESCDQAAAVGASGEGPVLLACQNDLREVASVDEVERSVDGTAVLIGRHDAVFEHRGRVDASESLNLG